MLFACILWRKDEICGALCTKHGATCRRYGNLREASSFGTSRGRTGDTPFSARPTANHRAQRTSPQTLFQRHKRTKSQSPPLSTSLRAGSSRKERDQEWGTLGLFSDRISSPGGGWGAAAAAI